MTMKLAWSRSCLPLFLSVFCNVSLAQVYDAQQIERVIVKGFRAQVSLIGKNESKEIQVKVEDPQQKDAQLSYKTGDHWTYSVKQDGPDLSIQIDGPSERVAWKEYFLGKQMPNFRIQVVGKSLPIEVFLHSGATQVTNWHSALVLQQLTGEVQLQNTQGEMSVVLHEGESKITGHQGKLSLAGFATDFVVDQLVGDLKLQNFKGGNALKNITGDIDLNAYAGKSQIQSSQGKLSFLQQDGRLHVEGFAGSIDGKSDKGSFVFQLTDKVDLKIASEAANVRVKLPPNSGALVNLGAGVNGYLKPPRGISVDRVGEGKKAYGRLLGRDPGRVLVRTESGSITVQ